MTYTDSADPRSRAVAFVLFANDDARYVDGEYEPSPTELDLAATFIDTLATQGYRIVP